MTTFVDMYHPALGNVHISVPDIPAALSLYEAHGWVLSTGGGPDPTPIDLTVGLGDLRYAKLGDIPTPGTATGDALRAAFGSRRTQALWDRFADHADGAISGLAAATGGTWQVTGAQPPAVVSGKLQSTGIGYAWQALSAKPAGFACEVAWSGTGSSRAMTMAATSGTSIDLGNLAVHFNLGPVDFAATVRQNGGAFETLIAGRWRQAMVMDGATTYRLAAHVRGNTLTVAGPFGEVFTIADPRIAALMGQVVFWEPNLTSGTQALLVSAEAYTESTSGALAPLDTAPLGGGGYTAGALGTAVGNREGTTEVTVGFSGDTNMPSVTWGPTFIRTTLAAPVTAGATSISTYELLPSGCTVQLESGTNSETVTTNNYPSGTGPTYSSTLAAATTKAHAAGTVVLATLPAGLHVQAYLNMSNGYFYLPNTLLIAPFGTLYLDGGFGASVVTPAPGVVGSGGFGAGKGAFQAGSWATTGRPAASAVPAGGQGYDTTLHKPIWSDGTAWRDAAGTVV